MLYNMEQHSLQFSEWDEFISLHYILHVIIPAFFEEKKGLCVTVRCPSVRPSGNSLPASPLTLLMLESPNLHA